MKEIKVQRFAEQMEIELRNNDHKGSVFDWNDFDNMITELEYHKAKMMMAVRDADHKAMKEYIADTANILMAIGNWAGLYDEDTVDDGFCTETAGNFFKRVPHKDATRNIKSVDQKITPN